MAQKVGGTLAVRCRRCGWRSRSLPARSEHAPVSRFVLNVLFALHYFGARHAAWEWQR